MELARTSTSSLLRRASAACGLVAGLSSVLLALFPGALSSASLARGALGVLLISAAQSLFIPGAATTALLWVLGALGGFTWLQLRAGVLSQQASYVLAAIALAFQVRLWLLFLVRARERELAELSGQIGRPLPDLAAVFVDNDIESPVPLATLREGHVYRVGAGQTLPADGIVTFGSGFTDDRFAATSPEDLRLKGMGSAVYAGTRLKNGSLLVRVTATGRNTFAERLAGSVASSPPPLWLFAPDLVALPLALLLGDWNFLLASSAGGLFAVLAARRFSLSRASLPRGWLWSSEGPARLLRCGMLVTPAPRVLTEGRPKLAAIDTTGRFSQDAAIGLLAPLARKLETPAAYALLLELRARNIPLQIAELFEPRPGGGSALVAGENVRWLSLDGGEVPPLGQLESFVREHENAGDEVCLLEHEGAVQAALAFRDAPVKGAPAAAEALRAAGFPVLLVSVLPKRCAARLGTELGVEHAQGEARERETEELVARLADEGLAPAWVQTQEFRPAKAAAVIAEASAGAGDLTLAQVSLPDITAALGFGQKVETRARLAVLLALGAQAGLLLVLLLAGGSLAELFPLGHGWAVNPVAVALAGGAPGFLAFFLTHAKP